MTHSFRKACTLALACVLLFACGLSWSAAYTPQSVPTPRPAGADHIANPDQIIDAEHAAQIEQLLRKLETDLGVQVSVVALADIERPADVFDFTQQLFELWGIGSRSRDDGLLVVLVRDQRTVRMHTGYGLEGLLPDLLCHRIEQQLMKPAFKEGRYGEGLLAGLTEVDRILRDPAAAQQTGAPLSIDADGWRVIRWIVSVPIAFIGLLLFTVRHMRGYFSREAGDSALPPVSMRHSRPIWLLCFVVVPLGIVQLGDVMPAAHRLGLVVVLLYDYFILMAIWQARRLHRVAQALFRNREHVRLHQLLGAQRSFWVWMAIWMPVPFLAYLPVMWSLRGRYRKRERDCVACGKPMRLLSEQEEDVHLSAARQTEERIGSLAHDVWACTGCAATERVSFPNADTSYESCPACGTIALMLEKDTVLTPASETTRGKGVRVHVCQHCRHKVRRSYLIPRISTQASSSGSSHTSSSSSSDSSRSSSSSSEWGGGRSGGGGASTSW